MTPGMLEEMAAKPVRNAREDTLFYLIKTVARHSAVYGVMNFLSRATSLILVPLYVARMTTAEYGAFEIFTVSQPLLQAVLLLGFNSALVRYYTLAESSAERTAYFRTALTTVLVVTGIAVVALFGAAGEINQLIFGDKSAADVPDGLWRLLFVAILFDTVAQMLLALYRARGEPLRYSAINLTQFALTLVLNVTFVGMLDMGIAGALLGILIANVVAAGMGLVQAGRESGLGFSRSHFDRLASFGFPLIISALAFFALNSSDRFFLRAFRGVSDVGIYALGYKIGLVISVLINAFIVAWPPLMYRIAREPDARAIYARVLTYFTLTTGFVFIGMASFSHEIVGLLDRPAYAGAGGFIWLILLSYLFQGIYYIFSVGVTITDKVKWIAIIVAAGAVLNIAANLVLIPRFGMYGAAWATLASFASLAIGMWAAARHEYPMSWEWGRLLHLVLLGGACVVVNLALIGHESFRDLLLKVLVIALFPGLLLATRFFSEEELLRARQLLERVLKRRTVSLP